jgi:mannose-6-phosphate isomerase-like protein (cupin superfamily)
MNYKIWIVPAISILLSACEQKSSIHEKDNIKSKSLTRATAPKWKNMKGYEANIEVITLQNKNFRQVLYTGKNMQLVVMSLKPGEEIGEETHTAVDQFFRVENGMGQCIINDHVRQIIIGDAIIVPAGAKHNIINTDDKLDLKLYTIYAPPNHEDKIIRKTKKDADEIAEKYDGKTTE